MKTYSLFAPCAKGIEYLLVDELKALGADDVRETLSGVHFTADLTTAYRVVLWSRLASRVLLVLKRFELDNADDVYEAVRVLPWRQHLNETMSIAVDFNGTNTFIRHTQFGAQRVKDAICDVFKEATGQRPAVDRESPQLRVNAHLEKRHITISIDLSGHALHERGYRLRAGAAPLKETLACAMLLRAQWPQHAAQGGVLIDPMCGSGTLLIEGAWMAADIAPGLLREQFGCNQGWLLHDEIAWQTLREEAKTRAEIGKAKLTSHFYGFDLDGKVLFAAKDNAVRAGVESACTFLARALQLLHKPEGVTHGLVISNPPYGERLGEVESLISLYATLGEKLLADFVGFSAAVITSENELAKAIGLRSHKQYQLFNGALACQLYLFDVKAENKWLPPEQRPMVLSEQAQGLHNRLEKNRKALQPWLKRDNVSCYRLYDADIPEYSAAIDVYGDDLFIQEYVAPKAIPVDVAAKRFHETVEVARRFFDCPAERVHLRQRSRQKGLSQYEKLDGQGEFIVVQEGGLKFEVNLDDYLDTGLFLDHRITRNKIREMARGKHFLNLFSYTGSVSVYAAAGGARSTTSVDMSRTYTEWAAANMELNGFRQKHHHFVQANVMDWIDQSRDGYDLIFVDPPTFSNSKRMDGVFDVQRDHIALLRRCLELLTPTGEIVFSNNFRRFKFEAELFADCDVDDWTKATIPTDFQRNPRIHQCWRIKRKT